MPILLLDTRTLHPDATRASITFEEDPASVVFTRESTDEEDPNGCERITITIGGVPSGSHFTVYYMPPSDSGSTPVPEANNSERSGILEEPRVVKHDASEPGDEQAQHGSKEERNSWTFVPPLPPNEVDVFEKSQLDKQEAAAEARSPPRHRFDWLSSRRKADIAAKAEADERAGRRI